MHPDAANFNFLAQMYGSIDGSIEAGSNLTAYENGGGDEGEVNLRQLLREREQEQEEEQERTSMTDSRPATPDWVYKSVKSIHEQLTRRRRLLRQSSSHGGETHHIDLGQGYSVAIYMLHADGADAAAVP